ERQIAGRQDFFHGWLAAVWADRASILRRARRSDTAASDVRLRTEAVAEDLVAVQLPPPEQVGERLRLIRRHALAGLVLLIDAVAAVAGADLAGLEFDPVALTHDGAAGGIGRGAAARIRGERLPHHRPLRRHEQRDRAV